MLNWFFEYTRGCEGWIKLQSVFKVIGVLVLGIIAQVSANEFILDRIEVSGLQRVSLGTVLIALPIREGQVVDDSLANEWLRAVYQTGFFYDVEVDRVNNSLLFSVTERPAIESISFEGNRAIPSDTLTRVFEDEGLEKGEIFSRSLLDNIQLELERQYGRQGRYNATVEAIVTPLTRNRVDIKLDITEGPVAKIQTIEFVGNQVFSDEELSSVLQLQRDGSSVWHLLNKRNQFSSSTLIGDLQRLQDFYYDNGYLDYQLESHQVSLSENKSEITIVINLVEGEPYILNEVGLLGDLQVFEQELMSLIDIEPGEVFSRKKTTDIAAAMRELLGEQGYAFAEVVDQRDRLAGNRVDIRFVVNPGQLVYVNQIEIIGNVATNDEVIRRELRQLERALLINSSVRTSRARLQRLGYFSSVDLSTRRIPGRSDLVDIIVRVSESKDSQVSFAGGYSDATGFYGEFSLEQSNFLGRGIDFSSTVNVSSRTQNYQFSMTNPYFTLDGVSLGAELYYRRSDYSQATFSTYALNSAGARVNLGYPLSENQRINYGLGYANEELFLQDDAPQDMIDFRALQGNVYNNITATLGWSYNTLNGTIKADDGASMGARLEVAVPPGDLNYYRLTANAQKYFNFADDFAFRIRGDVGYGAGLNNDALLPFYKNFYSGGPRSVRGFRTGSLGPLGTPQTDEFGVNLTEASPIGGNVKIEYGAELLIPTPLVKDQSSFRSSLFIDAGNVFTSECFAGNSNCNAGIDLAEIRYSAGLDLTWISPIAPLSFSYAWPLNARDTDYTTNFSFNIGVSY